MFHRFSCHVRQEVQNVRRLCIRAGIVRQKVQDAASPPSDGTCEELAEQIIDLSHKLTDVLSSTEPALADDQADLRFLNAVRDGLGSLQHATMLLQHKRDCAPYPPPVPPPLDALVGAPASQEQRDFRWDLFGKACEVYHAARRKSDFESGREVSEAWP